MLDYAKVEPPLKDSIYGKGLHGLETVATISRFGKNIILREWNSRLHPTREVAGGDGGGELEEAEEDVVDPDGGDEEG